MAATKATTPRTEGWTSSWTNMQANYDRTKWHIALSSNTATSEDRSQMGGVPTLEWAMVFVADSDTSAPPKNKAKAAEISAMYGRDMNHNCGNRQPLAPNECAKCIAPDGHWAYDCPNQEAPGGNNGGRGGRGGRGNRGGGNGGADRGGRGRQQREVNAAEAVESQETGSHGGQQAENA
ncbi:hypothetical protein K440DRAFT_645720 [Wilcoxina mikolae CBS 423.85]|nr:hypothetical protein K440DRAFT_645720 [Wilcoxina mikolae CBS 423.85]